MKQIKDIICSILFLIIAQSVHAQNVIYAPVNNESAREANVEILGKVGPNYLVFKNISWKNIIQVFDINMKQLSNDRIKFMSDKVINVDFITYPDYFIMIYQYKKNSTLYCDAVKMDAMGLQLGEIITIDTTRIGLQSGNEVYSASYSEDKKNILIYKLHERNDELHVVTKLYNPSLQLIDSSRSVIPYNNRTEQYSPFQVSNEGTIFFTKETRRSSRENIGELDIITYKANSKTFRSLAIDLNNKLIDGVQIKIDNRNNHYIVNSFYYQDKFGSIEGLFSAIIHAQTDSLQTMFNRFDDSLRLKMLKSGQARFAFDNLFLKEIFVKKDGGYVLVAEDYSSQNLGNNNNWNRYDYLYGNPYSLNNDYYWNSQYNRYNGYNSYSNANVVRHFNENILIVNIDSSLKQGWNNVILKSQTDDDDDRFLSYGILNRGAEVNFIYIEKERNSQLISNQSVSVYGKLYRYPTIKGRESGYQFMPRKAKQVGAKQLIVPCVYRGNICFAKVEF